MCDLLLRLGHGEHVGLLQLLAGHRARQTLGGGVVPPQQRLAERNVVRAKELDEDLAWRALHGIAARALTRLDHPSRPEGVTLQLRPQDGAEARTCHLFAAAATAQPRLQAGEALGRQRGGLLWQVCPRRGPRRSHSAPCSRLGHASGRSVHATGSGPSKPSGGGGGGGELSGSDRYDQPGGTVQLLARRVRRCALLGAIGPLPLFLNHLPAVRHASRRQGRSAAARAQLPLLRLLDVHRRALRAQPRRWARHASRRC
eukprot:scaffold112101_cov42-Phaeocystis_antarctica.AAC.1